MDPISMHAHSLIMRAFIYSFEGHPFKVRFDGRVDGFEGFEGF